MSYVTGFTKSVFALSVLLLLYGYLCRAAGLYFFWESKTIGWELFIFFLLFFFSNRIGFKKKNGRPSWVEKIGIGFLIFVLLIQTILLFAMPHSDACAAAKRYLQNDPDLRNEIGAIDGFFVEPAGSISVQSDKHGQSGTAAVVMVVKASRKYKDVIVYAYKEVNSGWRVEAVE